ncbi:hypothetical protein [Streptomyces sp. NPDC127108]
MPSTISVTQNTGSGATRRHTSAAAATAMARAPSSGCQSST